jgi:isopenicillin N synthase-like dioxygenase
VNLPVIDLSDPSPARTAARIDAALRGAGLFMVLGHGVPQALQEVAFGASRRFFALPEHIKSHCHIGRSAHGHGFDPIGWQSLDAGRPHDLKESFDIGAGLPEDHPRVQAGADGQGPNQWPDDDLVPGFRDACIAWAGAMERLSRRLMGHLEAALGLRAGHFDAFLRSPTCTTRLLHYPPQPRVALPGQVGCGEHTDWGCLTVVAQDDVGGLQVRQDGPCGTQWADVPPVPGALVVHGGDLLQRWTNDRWHAPVHRVVNRAGTRDRWAIAFFLDLDPFARIEPLPTCITPDRPARYAATTPSLYGAEMARRSRLAA